MSQRASQEPHWWEWDRKSKPTLKQKQTFKGNGIPSTGQHEGRQSCSSCERSWTLSTPIHSAFYRSPATCCQTGSSDVWGNMGFLQSAGKGHAQSTQTSTCLFCSYLLAVGWICFVNPSLCIIDRSFRQTGVHCYTQGGWILLIAYSSHKVQLCILCQH